jgi:hypothetical protein
MTAWRQRAGRRRRRCSACRRHQRDIMIARGHRTATNRRRSPCRHAIRLSAPCVAVTRSPRRPVRSTWHTRRFTHCYKSWAQRDASGPPAPACWCRTARVATSNRQNRDITVTFFARSAFFPHPIREDADRRRSPPYAQQTRLGANGRRRRTATRSMKSGPNENFSQWEKNVARETPIARDNMLRVIAVPSDCARYRRASRDSTKAINHAHVVRE